MGGQGTAWQGSRVAAAVDAWSCPITAPIRKQIAPPRNGARWGDMMLAGVAVSG